MLQLHVPAARRLLRELQLVRDYVLSSCMLLPGLLLAALWVPKMLHRRLIFQDSMYFFSETTKGRAYCLASATTVFLAFAGFMIWETLYFLGYQRVLPLAIFAC